MFDLLIAARSFGFASDRAINTFNSFDNLKVDKPEHTAAFDEDRMAELIVGRDAAIVGTDKVTRKVIEQADRLKVISKHGVGVDNIDIPAATEAGIIVTNLPGLNDLTVADMAMGMIVTLSRAICLANSQIKNRNWGKVMAHDVWGKTLGVIGTGAIGQAVIKRARSFDMDVIAFDAYPNPQAAEKLGFSYVTLEELIAKADFVSIHVPLLPETQGMIGAAELAQMKSTAYLINTSRGGIVDEAALIAALQSRQIAGAALDVFEKDFPEREELYQLDNLIVTPHIAAYTYETLESMDMALVRAYEQVMRGELPTNINILNPEITSLR